jgi:hypothetical protein
MEQGDPSGAKKARVEEESDEETQEPKTLWDNCLNTGDFIQETFFYDKDMATTDELEEDALIKAIERHCLQLTFLMHQCRRQMVAHNRHVVNLICEKEETTRSY